MVKIPANSNWKRAMFKLNILKRICNSPLKRTISIFGAQNAKKENPEHIQDSYFDEVLHEESDFQEISQTLLPFEDRHNCFIVQPYIKWGPQKLRDISPDEQLDEAKALINTLSTWSVQGTLSVPLEGFAKSTLFKSGSMAKIKTIVNQNPEITSVFINLGTLKKVQTQSLQNELRVPIFDRYKIVMQILRNHATSKHAKLQVAMAELYYMANKLKSENVFPTSDPEKIKLMFQTREQRLKEAIQKLRTQRTLLRNKRKKQDYPVVAVVGYTNAGKTSVIKALTNEEKLQPRNQLFATLDVTMHKGVLPSGLETLYVDTVGFISDIPTTLIECFVATLEDAVLADVILHVEDLSSSCFSHKRQHVLRTLNDLANSTGCVELHKKIVSVGNKCDIAQPLDVDITAISAKLNIGIDSLRFLLENKILEETGRQRITMRVPTGGDEIRWLYKNSTVVEETPDPDDSQLVRAKVIITKANFEKFKHNFV